MRINTVKAARKDQGTCESCGKPIRRGDGYRWVKRRYGPKRSRHLTCPTWKRWQLTGSEILASAWVIADEEVPEFGTLEEARDFANDLADRIEAELVELIQEKMDNIEAGFGHTEVPVWYDLDDRRTLYEEWAEIVRYCLDSFDEDGDAEEWREAIEGALGECPE